ncbi:MAG: class II aldolase/adducin family protein [Clostridium fessum]
MKGNRNHPKEALLHGALYRELPEECAIMHCHSPYATAWADKHETLDLFDAPFGNEAGRKCAGV